jgi:hypothetical protein
MNTDITKRQDVAKLEPPEFNSNSDRSFEEEFADWIRRAREAGYDFFLQSWEIKHLGPRDSYDPRDNYDHFSPSGRHRYFPPRDDIEVRMFIRGFRS